MAVYRLPEEHVFPDPEQGDESGLLAVGGDLSPGRLLAAYANGIFPWYDRAPPLWWSPATRPVLDPARVHVPRSLRKSMHKAPFRLTLDSACAQVIASCARARRKGQRGTWLIPEMQRAYGQLHELGFVHSCEAWDGDALVGGLYGLALGGTFFGESMFARAPDASKIAFVTLCTQLARWGFELVDCQIANPHTDRFGTEEIPRELFRARVAELLSRPTPRGRWRLDEDLAGSPRTPLPRE